MNGFLANVLKSLVSTVGQLNGQNAGDNLFPRSSIKRIL